MKMKTKEISSAHQGRIQHFHLGGGGGAWKIMCAHAHHGHKARRYGRGPGPAYGTWKLSVVFFMLSRAI